MSSYEERMAAKAKRKPNRKQRRAMLMQIRLSMQQTGSRILRRVQRRRELAGADWLKQQRRAARKPAAPIRSPELQTQIDIRNDEASNERMRYDELPTPIDLEEKRQARAKDSRASRRR